MQMDDNWVDQTKYEFEFKQCEFDLCIIDSVP